MKVTIVHDVAGEILAILQAEPVRKRTKVKVSFGIDPAPGQLISDFELTGDLAKEPLSEIHKVCHIDVKTRKLVRKDL